MSNFLLNLSLKMLNIFQGVTVIGLGDDKFHTTEGDTNIGTGTDPKLEQAKKLETISEKVKTILTTIAGPILIALGSVGVIYMVILGVQYAKSENDDKRATVKRRLVNLAIGVVAMFALATVCMAIQWDVIVPELFSYMKK